MCKCGSVRGAVGPSTIVTVKKLLMGAKYTVNCKDNRKSRGMTPGRLDLHVLDLLFQISISKLTCIFNAQENRRRADIRCGQPLLIPHLNSNNFVHSLY